MSKTGIVPKTAFKKGIIPWNKGKTFSEEEMNRWNRREIPILKCRICGIIANTEEEKTEFVKNKGNRRDGYTNICKKCYTNYRKIHGKQNKETVKKNARIRYMKNPNKYRERGRCAILYRRTRIPLEFNPRKGICNLCNKSIKKGEINVTHMHHLFYEFSTEEVRKNHQLALKNTIEVCFSCHRVIQQFQNALKLENRQVLINLVNLMPEKMKENIIKFLHNFNIDLRKVIENEELSNKLLELREKAIK